MSINRGGYKPFKKRDELEQDRIQRMSKSEQEKYAREALLELEEEGRMEEFTRYVSPDFGFPGAVDLKTGKKEGGK